MPCFECFNPCTTPPQRDYMADRLSWEREEKLVVSAWYEMVGGVQCLEFL